jgi:hypothetical protein
MKIYRHPDKEEGGGTEGTADAAAAQEIGALKHQLSEAESKAAEYQNLKSQVSALFNPNASETERHAALAKVMVAGGVSENDVQSMVSEILGGEATGQTGESPPPPPAATQAQSEEKKEEPNPLEAKVEELTSRIDQLQETSAADKQAQSKEALQSAVSRALTTSADAVQLMDRLAGARGKEHAEKVAELLRKDVLRETLENLYARKAQVGKFDPAWISEEATKAANSTLEKAKALMVTDQVGKAPGVLDEAVLLSELAEKEIKPPVYDKDKSKADNTEAADNWTAQRLQQLAAIHAVKAAQGGESKA